MSSIPPVLYREPTTVEPRTPAHIRLHLRGRTKYLARCSAVFPPNASTPHNDGCSWRSSTQLHSTQATPMFSNRWFQESHSAALLPSRLVAPCAAGGGVAFRYDAALAVRLLFLLRCYNSLPGNLGHVLNDVNFNTSVSERVVRFESWLRMLMYGYSPWFTHLATSPHYLLIIYDVAFSPVCCKGHYRQPRRISCSRCWRGGPPSWSAWTLT